MTEQKHFIITKIELAQTVSGRDVANLYSQDTRLRFPVLVLFNLDMLLDVGIDPNELTVGEPQHCKFVAYYEESTKVTTKGNPYRDITSLESPDAVPSASPSDDSAILAELRAIRALLQHLVDQQAPIDAPAMITAKPANQVSQDAPAMISTKPANQVSQDAPAISDQPPATGTMSDSEARQAFYALSTPAILRKDITPAQVNELSQAGNGDGWTAALAALQAALQP